MPREGAIAVKLNKAKVGLEYPVVYGTNRIEGNLVYAGVPAANADHFWAVLNFAEGECNGINQVAAVDQVFVDKELYTTLGANIAYTFYGGTTSQTYDSDLNTALPEWDDDKRYTCYVVFKLIYDRDLYRGFPDIEIVLEGLKIYDLRDATTSFNNNIVLCLYDYLTNVRYGFGISSALIHQPSWILAAEYCDLKGWGYDARIGMRNSGVVDDMLKHFRGAFDWYDGKLGLTFADLNYQVSQFTLTDDHLHQKKSGELEVSVAEQGRFVLPDGIRVEYIDPELDYVENEVPVGDALGNVRSLSLGGCHDRDMASQLGVYELERRKLDRSLALKCRGDLFQLAPNSVITATFDELGITEQLMRVQSVGYNDGLVTLGLLYDALVLYDDNYNLVSQVIYTCTLPDPNDPPPSVANPAHAEEIYDYRGQSYTRWNITFDEPANYPWFSHVEVWRSWDDAAWEHLFNTSNDFALDPVEEGKLYYLILRSVNIYGVKQALASGPKLSNTIAGLTALPASLTEIFAIANDNAVSIYGQKLTNPDIEVYEFRLGGWTGGIFLASIRSPNLNLMGVKPGTHLFYANTLSTNGSYGATPRSASTTLIEPPNGWAVQNTETCDYDGIGTHSNTEHVIYSAADHLKCSHSGDVLTGTYTSPEYDLGASGTYLIYLLADVVVTGAGTDWASIIPSPDTWADIGITTRRWQEIFALENAPQVQAKLMWGESSGSLTNSAEKMEILSTIATGRYFQVEITITDPSLAVNALVEAFTLKFCQ